MAPDITPRLRKAIENRSSHRFPRGCLEAKSEAPGRGKEFTVASPLAGAAMFG